MKPDRLPARPALNGPEKQTAMGCLNRSATLMRCDRRCDGTIRAPIRGQLSMREPSAAPKTEM